MCTFHSERSVTVCDVALNPVRAEVGQVLDEGVRFTTVHGEGTLIEADPTVDADQFAAAVQRGIDQVG